VSFYAIRLTMIGDLNAVENILYVADSYKITHHKQYPEGTTSVYSYFESRGGKFDKVCFFGLQYILKRWMVGNVVNYQMVQQAKHFYKVHFGNLDLFNEEGWNYIVKEHNGYLPLRIKAVPEGTVVPVKNVLFTVENTDPKVPWLTNWFETLLVQVWYPMTVCTNSRAQKEIIAGFLRDTTDSVAGLPFKLHDFGYRGASSVESAGIGGAAHLVNFMGTDTIAGLQLCRKYYSCVMAGFSIPAAEHSTITTWREVGESDAYRNMLTQFPEGLVSVVSDSYDIFRAVSDIWGDELMDQVIERGEKGCLVIRPDSGDPATVVLKVLNLLAEKFPCRKNGKGYNVLPSYLRVMQGDGISYDTIDNILTKITSEGWSAENVVFGTGLYFLQKLDRDTQKCAFKCSHVIINGESRNVCKNPSTDSDKRSKKGRLILERTADGEYKTVEEGKGDPNKDVLQLVFENGRLLVDWTLDEIREKAEIDLVKEIKTREQTTEVVNGLNKKEAVVAAH
ncbi:hypothetical protein PENTCL1PPCAC_6420, partial [Pristionchus entomophagus]